MAKKFKYYIINTAIIIINILIKVYHFIDIIKYYYNFL